MNSDHDIRNYCPGCGGNFAGNPGACDCPTGRQIQRLIASNKVMRKFVRVMALDVDDNLSPDAYDHALGIRNTARDCLKELRKVAR